MKMSRCNIKNSMISNEPHMFVRWITRKYGFFTQQHREYPSLFYLRFLFSRMTTINPQFRNQVYQSNRQFYLTFKLFFHEDNIHSKAFHRPAIFPAAVGKDFIYLPECRDLQNPGIIESLSSFRAIKRRKTESSSVFLTDMNSQVPESFMPCRNSETYFDGFFERSPGSPQHISQDSRIFGIPGRSVKTTGRGESCIRPITGYPLPAETRTFILYSLSSMPLMPRFSESLVFSKLTKFFAAPHRSFSHESNLQPLVSRNEPSRSKDAFKHKQNENSYTINPGNKGIEYQSKNTNINQGKNVMYNVPTHDFQEQITFPGTGSESLPSLSYSSVKKPGIGREKSLTTAEDGQKKSAAAKDSIEKIQGEKVPVISGSAGITQQQNVDLDRLTDQVYRLLERKIRIEKEMRGW